MRTLTFSQSVRSLAAAGWIFFSIVGAIYSCSRPMGLNKFLAGPLLHFFQTEKFPAVMNKVVNVFTWTPSEENAATQSRHIAEFLRTPSPGFSNTKATSLAASYNDYLDYLCQQAVHAPPRFIIHQLTYHVDQGSAPLSVGHFTCVKSEGVQ